MKNQLAAKRAGQSSTSWFQPQCDPENGTWLAVQCLSTGLDLAATNAVGVCWCADKKGAPLKGSLTRNTEPMCNHRQARRRMHDENELRDPVMEELIRQMTILVDDNLVEMDQGEVDYTTEHLARHMVKNSEITEKILEISTTAILPQEENQIKVASKSTRKLVASSTRCNALKLTAPFPVACDFYGSFMPMQCNGDICWCVDAAGNQLPISSTFTTGSQSCTFTPIDLVSIELHMNNVGHKKYQNLYETIQEELTELLKETPDNLHVEDHPGHILIKFDLTNSNKIDEAFAIEEMVKQNKLVLVDGELRPDITLSRFLHKNGGGLRKQQLEPQTLQKQTSAMPENTFQTIVFILATGSAFLVSIFVIFVMLKRGRSNGKQKSMSANKFMGMGDKHLDYSSPIFVLNAKDSMPDKSSMK